MGFRLLLLLLLSCGLSHGKPIVTLEDGQRYELKAELGSGSFGKVFAAINLSDNSKVAIKFFNSLTTYQEETSVDLGGLRDTRAGAYVVELKEAGKVKSVSQAGGDRVKGMVGAQVMEKVDGTLVDLASGLHLGDEYGKLKTDVSGQDFLRRSQTLFSLTSQMLTLWGGLAGEKLIHGDIKLANVGYLGDPPKIKLLDLGPTVRGPLNGSNPQKVVSTEFYAAPELVAYHFGNMPSYEYLSSFADFYSLGVTASKLLCDGCTAKGARELVAQWKAALPATPENLEAIRQLELVVAFIAASESRDPKERFLALHTGPLAPYVRFEGHGLDPYYNRKPRIHEAGLNAEFETPGPVSRFLTLCRKAFVRLLWW